MRSYLPAPRLGLPPSHYADHDASMQRSSNVYEWMERSHKSIIDFIQLLGDKLQRSFEDWRRVEKIGSRGNQKEFSYPAGPAWVQHFQ